MDDQWKWGATVLGLVLAVFTGFLAWTDHKISQPHLVVYLTSTELLMKPFVHEDLVADLQRVEQDYIDYTDLYIINLIDRIERTASASDELHSEDSIMEVKAEIGEWVKKARQDVGDAGQQRKIDFDELVTSLEDLGNNVESYSSSDLIAKLNELEDKYYSYSQDFIWRLIGEIEANREHDEGEQTVFADAVAEIKMYKDSLPDTFNAIDSELGSLYEELTNVNTGRLHVQVTLENRSQFPTFVRYTGAVAVFANDMKNMSLFDISTNSDQELESFSIQEVEFRSKPMTLDEYRLNRSRWESAQCIVSVQDVHGRNWKSDTVDCDDPSMADENSVPVNDWLRAEAAKEFGQSTN